MLVCNQVNTVYQMVQKGAVLVIKRMGTGRKQTMLAHLVAGGKMVEVEIGTAKHATERGMMRRLTPTRSNQIKGYRELGFQDDSCEYWVMMQ